MRPKDDGGARETIVEMSRLNGLSDGVFAFALTLLVLALAIPEGITEAELLLELPKLAPKMLVYLISFAVVGGAWGSHQRMFGQIRSGDGPLVWLGLLSLLFVTLLPAGAALLGRFPNSFLSIVCFAAIVIMIQLSALWLWRHASKQRLINPALDERVVDGIGRRLVINAGAFAVSIPLMFISPILVYVTWIVLFVFIFTTDWLSWRQGSLTKELTVPVEHSKRADLQVRYTGGRLHLGAKPMDGILASGRFGGGVESSIRRQGEIVAIELSSPKRPGLLNLRYPWAWGGAGMLDWTMNLAVEVPFRLALDMSVSESIADLTELNVRDLRFSVATASAELTLPAHPGHMTVQLEMNTGSIVLHIPKGLAARIHSDEPLQSAEVDLQRFPAVDGQREYRSLDFDRAVNRADISVKASLGLITVS